MPKNDLLVRISKGDTIAFRRFYDLFFQKVWQFTRYFIKSNQTCEEVVSDVFINIWLNKEKLPEIENIEAYLFIVTRNKAFNYLDKEGRIPDLEYPVTTEFNDESSDPESILIAKELESAIQNSIDQLPERCRIIFQMSRDEKLTHRKIAEILSISENTVHAQMVTALKKLHKALKKFNY